MVEELFDGTVLLEGEDVVVLFIAHVQVGDFARKVARSPRREDVRHASISLVLENLVEYLG